MGRHHAAEVEKYCRDAFGFGSSIEESSRKLIELFSGFGAEMYFDGKISHEQVDSIPCRTELTPNEVFELMNSLIR
mgnify:FL=1